MKVHGHVPLDRLRNRVPQPVVERLQESLYYAKASNALVCQSEEHKKKSKIRQEVFKKLANSIREITNKVISEEVSKGPPKQQSVKPQNQLSYSHMIYSFNDMLFQSKATPLYCETPLVRQEKITAKS